MHLDVILINDQLDALFLNVFISTPLHVLSSKCSSSGGPTSINTPSGITHTGGWLSECVITDGVLIQVGPPDDEHSLLETCRGVEINTLRKSASNWSLTINTKLCLFKRVASCFSHNWQSPGYHIIFKRWWNVVHINLSFRFCSVVSYKFTVISRTMIEL